LLIDLQKTLSCCPLKEKENKYIETEEDHPKPHMKTNYSSCETEFRLALEQGPMKPTVAEPILSI